MRVAEFLEPNGSSLSIALSPVLVRLIGRYSCNRSAPRCLCLLTLGVVRAIGRVSYNRIALVALGIALVRGSGRLFVEPHRPSLIRSASCGACVQPILLELHYPLLPLFFAQNR